MDKSQEEMQAKLKDWSFVSTDVFYVTGRGKAYAVPCPFTCLDFDWLVNRSVMIDGQIRHVIGVERFMHSAPWNKGESIAILTDDYKSL